MRQHNSLHRPIFVNDAVDAILSVLSNPTNSRVNISSQTETSLIALYREISLLMSSDIPPILHNPRRGEILRSALSNKRAKELLGWEPRFTLNDALKFILSRNYSKNTNLWENNL